MTKVVEQFARPRSVQQPLTAVQVLGWKDCDEGVGRGVEGFVASIGNLHYL